MRFLFRKERCWLRTSPLGQFRPFGTPVNIVPSIKFLQPTREKLENILLASGQCIECPNYRAQVQAFRVQQVFSLIHQFASLPFHFRSTCLPGVVTCCNEVFCTHTNAVHPYPFIRSKWVFDLTAAGQVFPIHPIYIL